MIHEALHHLSLPATLIFLLLLCAATWSSLLLWSQTLCMCSLFYLESSDIRTWRSWLLLILWEKALKEKLIIPQIPLFKSPIHLTTLFHCYILVSTCPKQKCSSCWINYLCPCTSMKLMNAVTWSVLWATGQCQPQTVHKCLFCESMNSFLNVSLYLLLLSYNLYGPNEVETHWSVLEVISSEWSLGQAVILTFLEYLSNSMTGSNALLIANHQMFLPLFFLD